jgi:hypothetical protein
MIEEVDSMRVYLCGAMQGCDDSKAADWRNDAVKYLSPRGITLLNPMDRDYRYTKYGDDPESVLPDLVEEDKIDIEMSDVLLVNYEFVGVGDNSGAGTNMEIILGWQKHKRVITVVPEDRQLSPWVVYHSHKIYHNMQDAYDEIVRFNGRIRV